MRVLIVKPGDLVEYRDRLLHDRWYPATVLRGNARQPGSIWVQSIDRPEVKLTLYSDTDVWRAKRPQVVEWPKTDEHGAWMQKECDAVTSPFGRPTEGHSIRIAIQLDCRYGEYTRVLVSFDGGDFQDTAWSANTADF